MVGSIVPENIRSQFDRDFSYEKAEGYVCSCIPGFEGENCGVNIDECDPDPCYPGQGTCKDEIAMYVCECEPGYGHGEDDDTCSVEIDECKELQPCVHGACIDRKNNYQCTCETEDRLVNGKTQPTAIWGGKNCSVELEGCRDKNACKNDGTCHAYLIDENNHQANCTCKTGFDGDKCQHRTTFSLSGNSSSNSYIKVASDRPDEYELTLRFKTSLSNGLIAHGSSRSDSETEDFFFFSLGLVDGSLSLNSSLITTPVNKLGIDLNNTEWQSVYISINSSTITLGVSNRLQATNPISSVSPGSTAFYNTFVGGIDQNDTRGKFLTQNLPSFTGCIEDITVNGIRITENSETESKSTVSTANTKVGCNREDQCVPNLCQNDGGCTDLWNDFSCVCSRPFLGRFCELNYTAGTFGYEDMETSIAIVDIDEPKDYTSAVDISMFIRTRKADGFIFYFGSDLASGLPNAESYITGELEKGNLVVKVFFVGNAKAERFKLFSVNLSDGNSHFIRVVRMQNSLMVKVNENTSINHEIPSPTDFVAEKIYLGNYPKPGIHISTTTVTTTTTTTTTTTPVTTTTTTPATTTQRVTAAPPVVTEIIESTVSSASPAENAVLVEENDQVQPVIAQPSGIVKRSRRQAPTAPSETDATTLIVERPYFKGIIQDVQISNGQNVRRIVEFFKNDIGTIHILRKPLYSTKLNLTTSKQKNFCFNITF
jgi:protein crumbs